MPPRFSTLTVKVTCVPPRTKSGLSWIGNGPMLPIVKVMSAMSPSATCVSDGVIISLKTRSSVRFRHQAETPFLPSTRNWGSYPMIDRGDSGETGSDGERGRRGARGNAQLGKDVVQVSRNSFLAEREHGRDL